MQGEGRRPIFLSIAVIPGNIKNVTRQYILIPTCTKLRLKVFSIVVFLYFHTLSFCLSVCILFFLFSFYLSVYFSLYVGFRLSIYLIFSLSLFLSVSLFLSLCLFLLSIFPLLSLFLSISFLNSASGILFLCYCWIFQILLSCFVSLFS